MLTRYPPNSGCRLINVIQFVLFCFVFGNKLNGISFQVYNCLVHVEAEEATYILSRAVNETQQFELIIFFAFYISWRHCK